MSESHANPTWTDSSPSLAVWSFSSVSVLVSSLIDNLSRPLVALLLLLFSVVLGFLIKS